MLGKSKALNFSKFGENLNPRNSPNPTLKKQGSPQCHVPSELCCQAGGLLSLQRGRAGSRMDFPQEYVAQ